MKRILALTLLFACTSDPPAEILAPPAPGLAAKPRWLTFTCVAPGCETTLVTSVEVVGSRSIAVKRVVLDDRDRTDFEFVPRRDPPFILKAGERFDVDVTYRPNGDPRLGDLHLLVTYTDAEATEGPDRIPPGELEIPLVRRLIGEPAMTVEPNELDFGGVELGQERRIPIEVKNTGFGNVGLVVETIDSSAVDIAAPELPPDAILPGESRTVDVVFRPTEEAFRSGKLIVRSFDPTAAPAEVVVRGTSIAGPSLEAPDAIDFGEVVIGGTASQELQIRNRGNKPLALRSVELAHDQGGMLTLKKTLTASTSTLAVLRSAEWKIDLVANVRGPIDSAVRITTSDPARPIVDVPIRGLVTQPAVVVLPGRIDFGALPRGWVTHQAIEIQNAGFGTLQVNEVRFGLGSSDLFTLKTTPPVPSKLEHDGRIGFEVEFRSETEASFNGVIAVSTNDPVNPYIEIPLTASGVSCEAGCPIANGEPSCNAGLCSIGRCQDGYYDVDGEVATGCECAELGRDPGEFCPDAQNMGTLDDGAGDRTQFTGIISKGDDVDLIRFFGQDSSQLFSEPYDVRITLESADPNIEFCVARHQTGSSDPQCVMQGEDCPGAARSYRDDGSSGPDDSADYVIRVYRKPGAPATCTPYTVFMRNG